MSGQGIHVLQEACSSEAWRMVGRGPEAGLGLAPRFSGCGSRDGDCDGTVDDAHVDVKVQGTREFTRAFSNHATPLLTALPRLPWLLG